MGGCALYMCGFTESRLTALERFIDNPAVVMGCLFGFGRKPEGGACLQGRNPPGQERRLALSGQECLDGKETENLESCPYHPALITHR